MGYLAMQTLPPAVSCVYTQFFPPLHCHTIWAYSLPPPTYFLLKYVMGTPRPPAALYGLMGIPSTALCRCDFPPPSSPKQLLPSPYTSQAHPQLPILLLINLPPGESGGWVKAQWLQPGLLWAVRDP